MDGVCATSPFRNEHFDAVAAHDVGFERASDAYDDRLQYIKALGLQVISATGVARLER